VSKICIFVPWNGQREVCLPLLELNLSFTAHTIHFTDSYRKSIPAEILHEDNLVVSCASLCDGLIDNGVHPLFPFEEYCYLVGLSHLSNASGREGFATCSPYCISM